MRDDLCTYIFYYTVVKNFFTDSAVAILPVSVRLIDKPVVNRLTVNITSI